MAALVSYSSGYAFGDRTVEIPAQPIRAREFYHLYHTHFLKAIKANAEPIAELKSDYISVASNETFTKAQPREFRKATRRYKKELADLYPEKQVFGTWEAERQAQRVTKYKPYLEALVQMRKDVAQLSRLLLTTLPVEIWLQVFANLTSPAHSDDYLWSFDMVTKEGSN
ncbi:hypothetical protein LTR37_001402 [Vermiconidia calcicola]|uniref:Uncharacterized protein n=1 Tax=Vermiconidia calcicola TaxID=1690605 RepID=A0ACC3NXD7_9PEZI|nr:hypothetical protein LTR37_001402 [Vermiconidia calcicola]